jgi:uncharacterized protein YceK
MQRFIRCVLVILSGLLLSGCASTMEDANQGAKEVGKPAGGIMRVPGSVMEGAAEGTAGQPKSNPYNR